MKKVLRLLSILTPFLLLAALFLVVDFRRMGEALSSVNVFLYLAAFGLYIVSFVCRALRLSLVFEGSSSWNFFLIVCGHVLVNHIMPFRTGEASLPFFLKRVGNIPYSDSVAFFVLFRLFDIIAIVVSFLFIVAFWGIGIGNVNFFLLGILLVLCVLATFNLRRLLTGSIGLASRLLPGNYSAKLAKFSTSTATALAIPRGKLLGLFLLSLLDRISNYGVAVFLVIGMSFTIPVLQVVAANAAAAVTNILPINSVGSFGTLELGWAGVLISFGIAPGIAAASGLSFHILFLTFTIFLGISALLILKKKFNINPFRKAAVE